MAADSDHARFIEQLGQAHEKRLTDALQTLENRIAGLIAQAPTKQGALFDLEWAIAARRDILTNINTVYLGEASSIVDQYTEAAQSAGLMLGQYGDFVGVSDDVIRALKVQSFQGFQDIAGTFLNELSGEIYQNTISGRRVEDSIQAIRQKINGVYAQSDQVEVQRLVNIANAGGAAAEEAIKQLHSIYAADKLGNNMRRYSSQIVHDSLMQFDASIVTSVGKESGADAWKYYGSNINDTRDWCREHSGKVYTEDEIRELWTRNWAGKAPGDPFIVRGGYNCRHHWRPVFKEDAETIPEQDQTSLKPQYVIPDAIKGASQVDDFAVAMNQLSEKQLQLVNKLPPIQTYAIESARGYYQASARKLVAQPLKDGGSIVRHEYGHHVDFEIGRINGNSGFFGISATDEGFTKAFDLDRKALGIHRTASFDQAIQLLHADIYDYEEIKTSFGVRRKKTLKDQELGNFSDIVDALSYGKMQKVYGGFGHGVTYFKRAAARPQEAFANLFALRNTKYWALVEQRMPNMAKRFDEIIEENL